MATHPGARLAEESPDKVICRTIATLRADFAAMLRGDSATSFEAFLSDFTKFDSFANTYAEQLSEDTLSMIEAFVSPLSVISANMAELTNSGDVRLPEDIVAVLADKTSYINLTEENDANTSALPAYVELCSRWLKEHCDNPYPSIQVRSEIALQTQTSRKDIDAWFVDARRRIGWNELRRKHFDNKRAEIVKAASIFFNSDLASSGSDDLPLHIENEFAAIYSRAASLYNERFSTSKLAAKLDAAVMDMTPAFKNRLEDERNGNDKRARDAYPTPERSPVSSTEALASPPTFVIDLTVVGDSPANSRKRRRPSECGKECIPPVKRQRSQATRRDSSPPKVLTSPPTSTQEEFLGTCGAPSPQPSSLTQLAQTEAPRSIGKRKRHLSDVFKYPASKRPQIRPQAVSDPFPVANTEDWDQWFREHVLSSPELTLTGDVPPPVTVDAPDSSTPLDIQLFNFPLIPDLAPSVPAAPAPAAEFNVVGTLEVPTATQDNVEPTATTLDPTFSWMSDDFPPPLQPTSTFPTFPSSTELYLDSAPFPTLDVITQPFGNTQSSAFLADPSLWSNIAVPELDFPALFDQPSTTSVTASIQVPSQPMLTTSKTLSEQEREAKRRELEELEARAQAIRAEISAP